MLDLLDVVEVELLLDDEELDDDKEVLVEGGKVEVLEDVDVVEVVEVVEVEDDLGVVNKKYAPAAAAITMMTTITTTAATETALTFGFENLFAECLLNASYCAVNSHNLNVNRGARSISLGKIRSFGNSFAFSTSPQRCSACFLS